MASGTRRREILKGGLGLVAASLGAQACGAKPPVGSEDPDGGPAEELPDAGVADAGSDADAGTTVLPRPTTTVRQRVQGLLPAEQQPAALKKLWGVTHLVTGEAHVRIDLLDVDATADAATGAAASLAYLAQLTDIHIIDEESPARTINLDRLVSPAWRAQECYSAQVLDAMVRKLRALDAVRPLDFALLTGDLIENNQKNELAWLLKILEGGPLQPNSGSLEDPLAGPDNDPHDALTALGLGPIPWYAAFGNHDGLIQGNLTHGALLDYSLVTGDPTRGNVGSLDLGRVNPPVCNPIPAGEAAAPPRCIPNPPSALTSGALAADPARAHLTSTEWRAALAAAPGLPVGHGVTGALATTGDGDFVVEPVPGVPLRLVVLNTVAATGGAQGVYPAAKIDGFLDTALKQAEADQVLVIVASHHPSEGIVLTGGKLRDRLNASPNVVLHLAGHTHENVVTARPGTAPHTGYWEVETSALAEWPQQGRLVELVDRRDGTAELWLTLVDYGTDHQPSGAVAAGSRFLALRELHSGARSGGAASEGRAIDRNVVLPVALTPALRTRLAAVGGKPIESLLFG
ncbi:MAG: metallophosphoesterase family protein [Myxococcaceae bacterium]